MATALLQPAIAEFLDVALDSRDVQIELGEVPIGAHSPIAGKPLSESRIHDRTGTFVIGVRCADGSFTKSPSASTIITPGCTLIAIGTVPQLEDLENLKGPAA